MKKISLFVALALILAATAVGMGYRIVLTQQGRTTETVSLSDDDRLLRPHTLGDLENRGELSILYGREIFDVIRAQIPINPHMSAPTGRHGIEGDRAYIIFSERSDFETVNEKIASTSVFSNNRGSFNGVLLPNALVLESPLSKADLKTMPVKFPETKDLDKNYYVLLRDREEFNRFITGRDPSENLNLLLPGTDLLQGDRRAARFVRGVNSFSILGENAVRAEPGNDLHRVKLLLFESDPPTITSPEGNWFTGRIVPPERGVYLYILPIFMAALGFLGLIMRGYPLRWALWALIGVAGFFFAPNWHLFLTGLIASGLVQFGLRIRGASIPWFILAGTVVYAFAFQPYLVDPFHGFYHFWVGFLLGLLTTLSGWSERIRKNPTYGDVIALVLGLGVLGVAVLSQYGTATMGQVWLAITLLPGAVTLITVINRPRHWPWITGMVAWFILFVRSGNTAIYVAFVLSMAGWVLIEVFRRFLTSGTTGRRPY